MERIKLAVDLDDTIADTTDEWVKEANAELGRAISKDEITEYDIYKVLGIEQEYVQAVYNRLWKEPHEIKLLDDNIPKILNDLMETFEIIIVTAAPGNTESIKGWLTSNRVRYDSLVKVVHASEKAELGDRIGIPIFVDDSPKVATDVLGANKYMVMVRQPWNARFIEENRSEKLVPVSSWAEASETLESISNTIKGI